MESFGGNPAIIRKVIEGQNCLIWRGNCTLSYKTSILKGILGYAHCTKIMRYVCTNFIMVHPNTLT